jgi:hypothetical protein
MPGGGSQGSALVARALASSSFMPPPLTVLPGLVLVPAPCPIHEKAHDRPHRVAPSGKPAGKRGVGRRISGTLACPGTTTGERAQRVLIELATEYEAIAAGSRIAV